MPKVGFVVNPVGGRGKGLAAWKKIEAAFPEIKPYFTTKPHDGASQAMAALADGCSVVGAVGGDGTVSEVANSLIGTGKTLVVVPAGTGNDYARSFGIPTDPVEAARLVFEGSTMQVDVGTCLEGEIRHRSFVNIAGVGFDAEVMTRFNNPGPILRTMPVKVRYYTSIFKTFAKYKGVKATLDIDGETTTVDNLLLLAVGCAQWYGAGMHILPMASLSDGLFDLAWGHDVRLSELNKLMSLIYKGEHVGHTNVKFAKCKRVSIHAEPRTPFHIDGDVTGLTPVAFECVPMGLWVAVPTK